MTYMLFIELSRFQLFYDLYSSQKSSNDFSFEFYLNPIRATPDSLQ